MFEPLIEKFGHHVGTIDSRLAVMESHLRKLAGTTESVLDRVETDRFITKATQGESDVEGNCVLELKPNEGFQWRTTLMGFTGNEEGNTLVYLGAINPMNLVGAYGATGVQVNYDEIFVPNGGILIFHFNEQGAEQICTVNVQAKEFCPSPPAKSARSGDSNVDIAHPQRLEPVPSPMPDRIHANAQ
jgi:hypothetical protein